MKPISPKVLAPVFTALTAVTVSAITTGSLNRSELAVLAAAAIGAVAAYIAPPGKQAEAMDVDPAIDDPEHVDDVPDLTDEDLAGRTATPLEAHANLRGEGS